MFAAEHSRPDHPGSMMALFGRGDDGDTVFDDYDEFVPEHLPEPGPSLADHEVLTSEAHVRVHRTARDIFEERGVYDSTFGYNLAKLNLDRRHPDAGFRYALDGGVLVAEFTPTTGFCPQSDVLTTAAHRAWNGLSDRHEFERVVVRVAPMHVHSDAINRDLAERPVNGQ